MSRRNGHVRNFGMIAKLGSDASLMGDLRAYPGGRQVIYLESNDAGALFRFTDTYSRVVGGQMWIAMDPPTADQRPQEGVLNVRDFSIRGEATLERVAANNGDPNARGTQIVRRRRDFSRMRAEFTRTPGQARGPRRRGVGPGDGRDDRRPHRLCARRRAHARHVRSGLCAQQHFWRTCRSSGCSSAADRTKACSA